MHTDIVACCGVTQANLPAPGEYVYADELPLALTKVQPEYPDIAREAGVQGTVLVEALVCTSGRVIDTRVVSSIPMLDSAAVGAVVWWTFSPASVQGSPVAIWVTVPIRFTLHGPS